MRLWMRSGSTAYRYGGSRGVVAHGTNGSDGNVADSNATSHI